MKDEVATQVFSTQPPEDSTHKQKASKLKKEDTLRSASESPLSHSASQAKLSPAQEKRRYELTMKLLKIGGRGTVKSQETQEEGEVPFVRDR